MILVLYFFQKDLSFRLHSSCSAGVQNLCNAQICKHPREVAKVFEEISPFYNDNVGFESWINTFLDTDGEKNTARMMLEKGKVSLHQAYPTFDNLLFNKIAREI